MAAPSTALCRFGQIAAALALLLLLQPSAPAIAQIGLPGTPDANEGPIRIQADSGIEWQQNQRVYIARGNAVAGRGNNEVRADTLIAHYREKAAPKTDASATANDKTGGGLPVTAGGEGGGNTEIYRVDAIGNVVLKHEASTVTGEHAIYDIDQGVAVITGKNLKLTTATDVVTARDSLEWHDARQIAVARGDAVATRATKTIKADILTAYMHKSATPSAQGAVRPGPAAATAGRRSAASQSAGPRPAKAQGAASGKTPGKAPGGGQEGESRISRVDAQGHVMITDALNTGRGDYGVYNGDTGIATLIGNVVIQRGVNVIQGQRGVMDLNNNVARMMPSGGSGEGKQRVQGLFVRDQVKPGAAPAGERKHP
jgi:lipopolysaccharide export system protein LptA